MGYLPEGNTDFVFSVLCEELGFVGAAMVIALFVLFVIVGWRVASRCQNLFGKMVAFGITATVGLQAAINIAVVTVTVPTKGIALPFISSGGTGWILTAGAVGLLMSIERHNRLAALVELDELSASQGFPVQMDGETATTDDERAALLTPVEVSGRRGVTPLRPVPVTATPVEATPVTATPVGGEDSLSEDTSDGGVIRVSAARVHPVAVVAEPVAAVPVVAAAVEGTPVAATAADTSPVATVDQDDASALEPHPLMPKPVIMVAPAATVQTPTAPQVKVVTKWAPRPEVASEPQLDSGAPTAEAPGAPATSAAHVNPQPTAGVEPTLFATGAAPEQANPTLNPTVDDASTARAPDGPAEGSTS
jgi:hypothetical protein